MSLQVGVGGASSEGTDRRVQEEMVPRRTQAFNREWTQFQKGRCSGPRRAGQEEVWGERQPARPAGRRQDTGLRRESHSRPHERRRGPVGWTSPS